MERQLSQNKNTQDETSMISAEQMEAVEERQLRRRAKWLLKNFRKFLEQKHEMEEEMRNTPLFTKDIMAPGNRTRGDKGMVNMV